MLYGTKVNGRLEPRFIETADLSSPSEIYQIDIETGGISDEAGAIQQLLTLEEQFPDLKILCIETDRNTNNIRMQFADTGPGQFSFTGLLAAIPILLGIVFVGVIAYVFWQIYTTNPILLWALLALGAGIAFFFFTQGKIQFPTQPIYKKEKTLQEREQRLKEERLNYLEKKLQEEKAEKEVKVAQTKVEVAEKSKEKAKKAVKKERKEKKQTIEI
jgi:hypothetical protein